MTMPIICYRPLSNLNSQFNFCSRAHMFSLSIMALWTGISTTNRVLRHLVYPKFGYFSAFQAPFAHAAPT
jgi:hypothetical protein